MRLLKKRTNSAKEGKELVATNFISTIKRIGILILVVGLVSLILYNVIGEPSVARLHNQNEIARFRPTLDHGLIQLVGETFLIAIVAFVARKWLRVRL